jgi:hypothetical protein
MDVRQLVKEEISKLQKVLAILDAGTPIRKTTRVRKAKTGHTMSASARRRISAAQKARWAKVKEKKWAKRVAGLRKGTVR